MSQNDYIILRDEDGKAYIAHASLLDNARNAIRGAANSISTTAQQVANTAKGVGRGVRKNHKYILKVFENGRTRYFYKQEEVKAYYEAKKRGIKNAAEYAQNAVKDKASDVADAVKNVANKATGATVNKAAETAKKNADDAHRWAKMTERAHKENLANFKQNPTEANLAKAKQSGQAVTRANQNEKNARKEADKAQDIADQHPVNKAKSMFDQAKKSADNAVANAKNNYERMKSEFRNKAEQAATKASDTVKETTSHVIDKAKDIAGIDEQKERDRTRFEAEKPHADVYDAARANTAQREYDKTPLGMIDRARVARKDKSEDLSAKAKSTAQSARDSVQGMIDNARSSTAKVVNEAWDRIPKNSDGTVNPFDKNFQSTYNDWKAKKDKYDSSLAGRAKDAAEKATESVKDMIDQAKKVVKGNSGSANARATKSSYGEYSDNDKDFAEKNYSKKNHVEDTDFYTFKRDDGKWVILEEDMKWVLPEGITGNDPGVRNALKQFADHASSAKAIGNENYNADQWVDAVTDAIDKAAEKQRKR